MIQTPEIPKFIRKAVNGQTLRGLDSRTPENFPDPGSESLHLNDQSGRALWEFVFSEIELMEGRNRFSPENETKPGIRREWDEGTPTMKPEPWGDFPPLFGIHPYGRPQVEQGQANGPRGTIEGGRNLHIDLQRDLPGGVGHGLQNPPERVLTIENGI